MAIHVLAGWTTMEVATWKMQWRSRSIRKATLRVQVATRTVTRVITLWIQMATRTATSPILSGTIRTPAMQPQLQLRLLSVQRQQPSSDGVLHWNWCPALESVGATKEVVSEATFLCLSESQVMSLPCSEGHSENRLCTGEMVATSLGTR